MLDKALVPKVLTKAMLVYMLKMSAKPLLPKFWWRQVVVVTKDIDEDIVGVDIGDVREAPLVVGI
jgi:hypothetical protein